VAMTRDSVSGSVGVAPAGVVPWLSMSGLRAVAGTPDDVLAALGDVLAGRGTPFVPVPDEPALAERVLQAARPEEPLEQDCALVLPTSGSTGEPKAVLLSASALLASATATLDRLGGPGQWLLAMPPYFVGGLQVLTRSVVAGIDPVVADSNFGRAVAAMTGARRYTAIVPTQLRRLLDTSLEELRSFDAVLVGAAATPAGLLAAARETGVRVVTTYGMTETGGGCVYDGVPLDGVDVDVLDGRIVIRGATLFSAYRLRPDLTADALRDGRFRTQDAGRITGGRLEILGRLDDVAISGGVNVALPAVQARVLEHPAVTDAVVLGVPDAEWGARVVAFVVGRVTLAELRDFVAETLPRTWAPRDVVLVDALPMLASGKVDRQALLG
jgi:o-succinylbenzoate---CoA ligase